jgi:hypothetical protein
MAIVFDHTIVPAEDKVASAEFFAEIFGLKVKPGQGHYMIAVLVYGSRNAQHLASEKLPGPSQQLPPHRCFSSRQLVTGTLFHYPTCQHNACLADIDPRASNQL